MKGYYLDSVYMGYLPSKDKYIPFATEEEYVEYFMENEEDN